MTKSCLGGLLTVKAGPGRTRKPGITIRICWDLSIVRETSSSFKYVLCSHIYFNVFVNAVSATGVCEKKKPVWLSALSSQRMPLAPNFNVDVLEETAFYINRLFFCTPDSTPETNSFQH